MHQGDFEGFRKQLVGLGTLFGKELTDELVGAYWASLKDLALSTVTTHAQIHMRYGKFFPKPIELRPKTDKPPMGDTRDDKFREGEGRSVAYLEALRVEDPGAWLIEVRARHLDRVISLHGRNSSAHHEAERRWADRIARDSIAK